MSFLTERFLKDHPVNSWNDNDVAAWNAFNGVGDSTPEFEQYQQLGQQNLAQYLQSQTGVHQQLTPEEFAAWQNAPTAAAKNAMAPPGKGITIVGDQAFWSPLAAPQHSDQNGPFSLQSAIAPGSWAGGEQGQSNLNDMKYGAVIGSLPFLGAGITALGAGAAAGGGAVGAGETAASPLAAGVTGGGAEVSGLGDAGGEASLAEDAGGPGGSETLFPGESATSGSAGSGSMGESGLDTTRLLDSSYWNPEGGTTGLADPGASGVAGSSTTYGSTDYLAQAQALAKQYGITPSSAMALIKNLIAKGAPAALGAVAANNQANSLSALADKYAAYGAPSRARYEASFAPGFSMESDPGYKDALDQTAKATLHGLSVTGNPSDSPNAWTQTLSDVNSKFAYPALQAYRGGNAAAGGIATGTAAAPGLDTSSINARTNVFNALGAGANDIFNPQPSLAQTLAEYQRLLKAQGSGAVQ